jgi:hypothetical protein
VTAEVASTASASGELSIHVQRWDHDSSGDWEWVARELTLRPQLNWATAAAAATAATAATAAEAAGVSVNGSDGGSGGGKKDLLANALGCKLSKYDYRDEAGDAVTHAGGDSAGGGGGGSDTPGQQQQHHHHHYYEAFAFVSSVTDGSPAGDAGMVVYDLVTRFGPIHASNHQV